MNKSKVQKDEGRKKTENKKWKTEVLRRKLNGCLGYAQNDNRLAFRELDRCGICGLVVERWSKEEIATDFTD